MNETKTYFEALVNRDETYKFLETADVRFLVETWWKHINAYRTGWDVNDLYYAGNIMTYIFLDKDLDKDFFLEFHKYFEKEPTFYAGVWNVVPNNVEARERYNRNWAALEASKVIEKYLNNED